MSIPKTLSALVAAAILRFGPAAILLTAPRTARVLSLGFGSTAKAMSAPTVDRARLCRLFAFIREHQVQAGAAGDEVRVMKWERLVDKLLDRMPRSPLSNVEKARLVAKRATEASFKLERGV